MLKDEIKRKKNQWIIWHPKINDNSLCYFKKSGHKNQGVETRNIKEKKDQKIGPPDPDKSFAKCMCRLGRKIKPRRVK